MAARFLLRPTGDRTVAQFMLILFEKPGDFLACRGGTT
jgi:hypothetical protein